VKLYTYYRSQRVSGCASPQPQGLAHDDTFLHLERGDQFAPEYQALNPQMVVPTLIDGDAKLFQVAGDPRISRREIPGAAAVAEGQRGARLGAGAGADHIADSHPLIVPRIRHYLLDELQLGQDKMLRWIRYWLGAGLAAMETLLAEHKESGDFCHGERPTVADIALVTQWTPAKTFDW